MKKWIFVIFVLQLVACFADVLAGKLKPKISKRTTREKKKNENNDNNHRDIEDRKNDSGDMSIHLKTISDVRDFVRLVHVIAVDKLEEIDLSDVNDGESAKKINSLQVDASRRNVLKIHSSKIDSSRITRILRRHINDNHELSDRHRNEKIRFEDDECSDLMNEAFRFFSILSNRSKISTVMEEYPKILPERMIKIQETLKKVNNYVDQERSNESIDRDEEILMNLQRENEKSRKCAKSKKPMENIKNRDEKSEILESEKNDEESSEDDSAASFDEKLSNEDSKNTLLMGDMIRGIEEEISTSNAIIDETMQDFYSTHETTLGISNVEDSTMNSVTKSEEILKTEPYIDGEKSDEITTRIIDNVANEANRSEIETTTIGDFSVDSANNFNELKAEDSKITRASNNETTREENDANNSNGKGNTNINMNINNVDFPTNVENNNINRTTNEIPNFETTMRFGSDDGYKLNFRKNNKKPIKWQRKKSDEPIEIVDDLKKYIFNETKDEKKYINDSKVVESLQKDSMPPIKPRASLDPCYDAYRSSELAKRSSNENSTRQNETKLRNEKYVMDILLESINTIGLNATRMRSAKRGKALK